MQTMHSIIERSIKVKDRLDEILVELQKSEDPNALAVSLAEEIALLVREQAVLQYNIKQHEAMAEHLANSKCSGPH